MPSYYGIAPPEDSEGLSSLNKPNIAGDVLGGVASNLYRATPWGIGGTVAGLAGNLIGRRNYKTGGAISGLGKGAATGAMIGSIVPGIGTAIGGIAGGLIGGIKGLFGGKKKKELMARLAKERQAQEDADKFLQLKSIYGRGVNPSSGLASTAAQNYFNQQSREDQQSILKSFGNRDALEEWYQNAKNAGSAA